MANPLPTQRSTNPFPAWRLKSGVKNASDGGLEIAELSCERWGWGCGGLVVVGLIIEFAIAFSHPHYDSPWGRFGSVFADFLVAIGVAGEVLFSRMGFIRSGELQRRSHERAANAELETARLKERFGWRLISPAQKKILLERLSKYPSNVGIRYLSGEAGSAAYAIQFRAVLQQSGWKVSMQTGTAPITVFSLIVPDGRGGANAATLTLREALDAADIEFDKSPDPDFNMLIGDGPAAPSASLYIGPRLMPWATAGSVSDILDTTAVGSNGQNAQ